MRGSLIIVECDDLTGVAVVLFRGRSKLPVSGCAIGSFHSRIFSERPSGILRHASSGPLT